MEAAFDKRKWSVLLIFGLIGQIAWSVENMYFNLFVFDTISPNLDAITLMVQLSGIAATLVTLVAGTLSDKLGNRRSFISIGYIIWGITVALFGFISPAVIEALFDTDYDGAVRIALIAVIAGDCVMTFFGSTANDAAFSAWVTDNTESSYRGRVESILSILPLAAMLIVAGGFGMLVEALGYSTVFLVLGIIISISGIYGIFSIKDSETLIKNGTLRDMLYGFKPSSVIGNKPFYLSLVITCVYGIACQIFMPYLILYYEVSLKMSGYVFIMAPAIILASVVTAFWGKVYDKKGFSLSSGFSLIWLAAGYVLLYFFRSTALVFLGSLLMMCGYLSGMAVFGAKIRELTPEGRSGMFQGVRIFSQVLVPGVVGPFIGKSVLANAEKIVNNDGTESFVPNENIFLAALVAVAVLSVFLLVFSRVKKVKTDR